MGAIPFLREIYPLRYVNLDIGYYSRGFVKSSLTEQVKREIFLGISLNINQLLHDIFPSSSTADQIGTISKYYQIPKTGLELNSWRDYD